MNKFVKLALLTSAVMIGASSVSFATFSDMPTMENYEEAINYLVDNGIISGYPDNTFKPDKGITRAEFSKMVILEGVYEDLDENVITFEDVSEHWANEYIQLATKNGIIKGYTDNTFKPNNEITYGEAATMLIRSLKIEDKLDTSLTYPDNYMHLAEEIGLFNGIATNDLIAINPARRDNVALMFWNKIKYEEMYDNSAGGDNDANNQNNNQSSNNDNNQGSNDEIDTKKLYMGIVKVRTLRRGEWYITVDSLDGEKEYKLYGDSKTDPKLKAYIVYTLTKNNELKLKKYLLPEEINNVAFVVTDVEDKVAIIKDQDDLLDLDLKKFKTKTGEIDLEDYTYFLVDMFEKQTESKDENGVVTTKIEYEFDTIEEIDYEKINLKEEDRLCFDEDTGIALIIRGIETPSD